MNIKRIETFVLRTPLAEPFGFSQGWYNARTAMLVRISADDGQTGWGEAFGPPAPIASIIEHILTPILIDQDPTATAPLWDMMYAHTRDFGQGGLVIHAISAIDIALWDLKGKIAGRSVSRMLGGRYRETVQAYATGLYFRQQDDFREELVQESREHLQAGFTAMKLKIGLTPERDLTHARAVRDAIGPDVSLMVDANHAYDATTAIRLGRQLHELNIGWFEEPVVPEDIEAYQEVKEALEIPVAGGEAVCTRFGFKRMISGRSVDILQPDLTIAGGFTECSRISTLASTWGLRYVPHVWGSAIGLAASLQLIAALPPASQSLFPLEPLLEFDRTPNPFRDELAVNPVSQIDGWVTIPDKPGIGIDVDEYALHQYRVT